MNKITILIEKLRTEHPVIKSYLEGDLKSKEAIETAYANIRKRKEKRLKR